MDKSMNNNSIHANMKPRKGCRDIWNAYMCKGAHYSKNDIPICPTTASDLPNSIILWDEAKHIYKKAMARGDIKFLCDSFVCFYMDDYKFDGPRGIWHGRISPIPCRQLRDHIPIKILLPVYASGMINPPPVLLVFPEKTTITF